MKKNKKTEVLNALLEETLDTVRKAKDFTIKEAPELAKEVILDAKVQNGLALLVGLGLAYVSYRLVSFGMADLSEASRSLRDSQLPANIVGGLIGTVSFFMSGACISDILSLYVAPKTYILKKLSSTIKGEE